jgi:hypothetical protein
MISISDGKQADVRVLDKLIPEPGAFYVMDRGYVDFQRLYQFELAGAFFVTRAKTNLQFNRLESRPVDSSTGVRSDQIIWLRNFSSIQHYPDKLRRIHYVDAKTGICADIHQTFHPLHAWLFKETGKPEICGCVVRLPL